MGTNVGDIGIWEVGSRERIVNKTFKIREISNCSVPLQVTFMYFGRFTLIILNVVDSSPLQFRLITCPGTFYPVIC